MLTDVKGKWRVNGGKRSELKEMVKYGLARIRWSVRFLQFDRRRGEAVGRIPA